MICIEGIIGCGKSTLCDRILELHRDTAVLHEPVDEWRDDLIAYYNEPYKNAYKFQKIVIDSRINQIKLALQNDKPIIVERSVVSSKNVFARMLHNQGYLNDIEFIKYTNEYFYVDFEKNFIPAKYVYIEINPVQALQNIKKRGRDGEETITLEYLIDLDKHYKEWLSDLKNVQFLQYKHSPTPHQNVDVDAMIREILQ
jgi:deoxyadenosine/deoxycytidine kinase